MTRIQALLGCTLALAACNRGGSGNGDGGPSDGGDAIPDGGSTDASSDDAALEPPADGAVSDGAVFDDAAPPDPPGDAGPACAPNAADGPIVALEWGAVWETSLVGVDHPQLALDDLVFPRPRTQALRVEAIVPPAEPRQIDGRCPQTLDFAALRREGDAEDVALAEIVALEPENAERRGRVTWSAGPEVKIEGASVPEPRWLIFEPAGGPARLLMQPAAGPPPWSMAVPDVPGTVALVHTRALAQAGAAVHAPPGFAAHWRARVTDWAELDAAAWTGTVALAPFSLDTTDVPLGEDPVALDTPRLAIVGPAGRQLTLSVPCGQPVRVAVSGFADLQLDQQEQSRVVGPPDGDLGLIECLGRGETEPATLIITPLLRREVAVRIEVAQ